MRRSQVEFFDSSGALFWPNTVIQTNSNTLTATFTTPQSGTAVLHKAGVITLATGTQAILSNPGADQTITGAYKLTLNAIYPSKIGAIRYACSGFAGSDGGAKVNSAFTDLAGPGEVWVDQSCGTTWTTAVTISTGQVLRFIQGGTYNLSAAITMSGNSPSLVGTPHGGQSTINFTNGGTILKQSNSVNLANLVVGSGDDALISDINLDGNKSNNTTTVGVSLTGQRPSIRYSNITSFPSHGISYTNSNDWMDLDHVMVYLNGGHGLSCSSAADLKVSHSQFQTNTLNGIDLNNCSGSSFSFNEVSGNLQDGIKMYGVTATGSNFVTYANNLMGQNAQNDIEIVGSDAGGCLGAFDIQILGNRVNGGGPKAADNTYDILKMTDACHVLVDGNQFFSSSAPNRNKYGIENTETGAGRSHDVIIGGLNHFTGSFGTSLFSTTSTIAPYWALPTLADMAYVDSANTVCHAGQLSAGVLYSFGCSGQQMNFQPVLGTNTLVLTANTIDGYKPHRLIEQAAPSGSAGNDMFWGDSTAHCLKFNNNNAGASGCIPQVIASGTSTLTSNAALGAVTSQAAITTGATGAATTDAIEWSYASAPTAGDSLCTVSPYVTSGNVNFVRTNPTAAAQNVSAIVINWRVIR
jgi:hypothetical protein